VESDIPGPICGIDSHRSAELSREVTWVPRSIKKDDEFGANRSFICPRGVGPLERVEIAGGLTGIYMKLLVISLEAVAVMSIYRLIEKDPTICRIVRKQCGSLF